MSLRNKALKSYSSVNVQSGVAYADNIQLVQMLFDGLCDSLAEAEGQIQRNEIAAKGKSLSRASRIVFGLQSSLDFDRGGEIARNLSELYSYSTRRILHANLHNDVEVVKEVRGLIGEIRDAWKQMPELMKKSDVKKVG